MSVLKTRNEGMALVLALFSIIVIAGAIALVMGNVRSAQRDTDSAIGELKLEEACKAAIDIGIEQIWNQYVQGQGNTTGNLASYRVFINDVVQNNEDLNRNGVKDGTEQDWNGDGSFETADPLVIIGETNPRELGGNVTITSLTVSRTDDVTGVTLTFVATAEVNGRTKTAQQTLRISGARFTGFQYAILANNVNCIMCHLDVFNIDLVNNTDATKYGTFDRVKVACLESLMMRPTEANTEIAGSLYTRGSVFDGSGAPMSAAAISSSQCKSKAFSSTNGKITQSSSGAMTATNMAAAGTDSDGNPLQFANLYMNYPTEKERMTDGELPNYFPAPFPDDNGDRYVNQEEFEKYVNSANGSISFELPPSAVGGSVTAGVAYGVPAGSTYTATTLPTASNDALTQLASTGSYEGNLILVGTKDDPIVINDKVAVNGDLVIKGPVKGNGQLLVSGNAYVIGDVTYADAPGKFGEAADGTTNAFALSAGGNIMVGDYLTRWKKKCGTSNNTIRVNVSTYGTTYKYGYFDSGVVDTGQAQGDDGILSFTTSELMLFNRMEREKSAPPGSPDYTPSNYIPGYVPRYYQIREGAPIYQFISEQATGGGYNVEHASSYFDPSVEVIPSTDLAGAAILSLGPKNGWMSENSLRNFWFQEEANRRATSGASPFLFDGLLYTNNCIFGICHTYSGHRSDTYGMMRVRGAMVCADLGLLSADNSFTSTTGLKMYYDKRVDAFMNVEDPTQVTFGRLAFQYLNT